MNSYQHLQLLLRYDRTFGLWAAIFENMPPKAQVLDAGAGLGILSQWAIKAGADKVTAVDLFATQIARDLAYENGLFDKIDNISGDLNDPNLLNGKKFDVIIAMIYLNDPRRDEQQVQLAYNLRDLYLKKGGLLCPDRVVYTAVGMDWPDQDYPTKMLNLDKNIRDIEERYGISFQALKKNIVSVPTKEVFPTRRTDGCLIKQGATVLTDTQIFKEFDYYGIASPLPSDLTLHTIMSGRVNAIVWTQKLYFKTQLIFANESMSWIRQPRFVKFGDKLSLRIDESWRSSNILDFI